MAVGDFCQVGENDLVDVTQDRWLMIYDRKSAKLTGMEFEM